MKTTLSKPDTRKWGWMEDGSDTASGPFDTKGEAITDAIESLECEHQGPHTILIGRCELICPVKVADSCFDMDQLLESMEEHAAGDCCFWDDNFFDIHHEEREEARISLTAAIRTWARAYLTCSVWQLEDDEPEEIYIPNNEETLCPSCYGQGTCIASDKPEWVTCETCKGKGYILDKVKRLLDLNVAISRVQQDQEIVGCLCHGIVPNVDKNSECPVCRSLSEGAKLLEKGSPLADPKEKK